jgi:acetyl-CoA acetyltransferase
VTTTLECAKRADGAAALLLVAADACRGAAGDRSVAVLGGGEASGPLAPPQRLSEACFSAAAAAEAAYRQAGVGPGDVDYWGLYDCFPICLIRCAEQELAMLQA